MTRIIPMHLDTVNHHGTMRNMSTVNDKDETAAANVPQRAQEVMLKLLNLIYSELDTGRVPTSYLDAYETLCRAEASRRLNHPQVP